MSFCKNCGTNIGNNKFCANCGTPSNIASYAPSPSNRHSAYYHDICDYSRAAKSVFVFGLLSLIFCMGIGLIFQIICFIKIPRLSKYDTLLIKGIKSALPEEIETLKAAKKSASSGTTMCLIGFFTLIVALLATPIIILCI